LSAALFSVWGIWSISHRYGGSPLAWGEWLAGICAGAAVGWLLLRRATLTVDASTGTLWRSADYSLLPLLLVTFVIKYGFETALAVAPGLSSNAGFSAAYLLLSGGFTGSLLLRDHATLVAFTEYNLLWALGAAIALGLGAHLAGFG